MVAAILLLTVISYAPVFNADFVNWDDEVYVLNNEKIHELNGENLAYILTKPIGGIYQPLTMLSLAFDYAMVGAEARLFHIHNLLLHLVNALLVFLFVRRLIGRNNVAIMVMALFAVHTLHVESVAWVTERKDVLYTMYYLVSAIFYLKYIDLGKRRDLGLAGLFFLLAVLAKPAAVVLAGVFPLLDWFRGRKLLDKKVVLEKLPFLALAIFFGYKLVSDQVSIEAVNYMDNQGLFRHSVFAGYSFVMYLAKTLLPINLSTVYPVPAQPGEAISGFHWAVTAAGTIGFFGVLWYFRKLRWVVFGMLFFLGNVVLMLQWIPVGYAYQSDRFTYVASIGLFLIIAVVIGKLMDTKSNYTGITAFTAYVLMLSVLTNAQAKVWENSLTLWDDVISKYDNVYIPYSNRGYYRYQIGDIQGALEDFNKCIELKDNAQAYVNRGNLYQTTGQSELALQDFTKAIELAPEYADAYVNRGVVEMGMMLDSLAIEDFDRALDLIPNHVLALKNKGSALYNLKRYAEVIPVLNLAIEEGGPDPTSLLIRGLAHFAEKNHEQAVADYNDVLAIQPQNAMAFSSKGAALREMQNYSEAIANLDAAINFEPYNGNSYNIRGLCHAETGNVDAACPDFEKALQLGHANAQKNIDRYCAPDTTLVGEMLPIPE